MECSLYRQPLAGEPIEQSPKAIPMSEEEREETKRRLIEYAERALLSFEANHRYLREYHAELLKEYPDQWVAVHDQEVVASDSKIEGLFKKVDQLGIHRGEVAGKFMNTHPKPMIL